MMTPNAEYVPPTCILTGAEGEDSDDCTTHDHEKPPALAPWLDLHTSVQAIMDAIDVDINNPAQLSSKGQRMPWDIASFADLHDYVDANEYLIEDCDAQGVEFNVTDQDQCDLSNAICDAVTDALVERNDRGVEVIVTWTVTDCKAEVLCVPWLTTRPYVLRWTDFVANTWDLYFSTASAAVVALGALVRCQESDWATFLNGDSDVIEAAAELFLKVVK